MKTTANYLVITLLLLFSIGCNEPETPEVLETQNLTAYNDFQQAQKEVMETWEAIVQSVKQGDLDKLISFHDYSPKFTEFKNGELRNGGEENEAFERGVFGSVTEVVKLEAQDIQIAVYYGNVANMTFHSNFHLKFGDELVIVREQTSLLFVKTKGEWKIVHEHHSPLNQ